MKTTPPTSARSSRAPWRLLVPLLLAAPLALGCAEDEAQPGQPGGPCQVGAAPCVEGYACVSGVCAVLEADAGASSHAATITFPEARVPADGQTAVEFDFLVTTVPVDGEQRPYDPELDGQIFLTAIPAEAGRIEPARPVLVQGLGLATFTPCSRGEDPVCPEAAVIRIARDDAPLDAIGESMRFVLTDPRPDPPADMGVDGGM